MEKRQHINVLELRAAELALNSFKHLWQGSRVCLPLDNTTAVAQIVKIGSPNSRTCLIVMQEIMECVLYHGSAITAQYMAGKENIIANNQSRVFRDSSSWRLDPQVFRALIRMFPCLQVDLFADHLNHQLTCFWSWRLDPLAVGIDSLTKIWKSINAYVFPPRLLHKNLRKVQNEGATVLVEALV